MKKPISLLSKNKLPPVEFLPKHIGIIMDGNGRWAKKRHMPRSYGHRQGAKVFETICRYCRDISIPFLTVYAFSTENWKRPKEEVNAIMNLLRSYLDNTEKFKKENIRIRFIGDISVLDEDLKEKMERAERESKDFDGLTVNVAVNYGGRSEIVKAAQEIAVLYKNNQIAIENINETTLSAHMYTKDQPDPDLIIRPSGEQRTSNFLVWQSAYAELVFMDTLWPDFNETKLNKALWEYASRNRRFGGI